MEHISALWCVILNRSSTTADHCIAEQTYSCNLTLNIGFFRLLSTSVGVQSFSLLVKRSKHQLKLHIDRKGDTKKLERCSAAAI
jgi:hypothetical protein